MSGEPALPTGGGAISGMGETFQPDLHTGTGNLTIPLPLPPGRGALTPHLNLTYSSGNGNGPFGLGWALSMPRIARRTDKGVPGYDDDLDVFVLSGAEELTPVPLGTASPPDLPTGATATRYRPRTDTTFARIVHVTGNGTDYWDVWTPEGLRSRYGTPRVAAAAPGWTDPAAVRAPGKTIFSWLLAETRDTLGNTIAYSYVSADDPQRYLSTIRYADYGDPANPSYAVTVTVRYDPTPRPDPFTDRKPGFALTTTRRATTIEMATVGSGDTPATTIELGYLDGTGATGHSLLGSVQVVGHDGSSGTEQRLPPMTFEYSGWDTTLRRYRTLNGPLPPTPLGAGTELVDLFADGLPCVLELNGTARYWRNRGGTFEEPRALTAAPAGVALGAPGILLSDLDGDGRPEIAVTGGAASLVWALKDPFTDPVDQAGFAPPVLAGPSTAGIDLTDPTVRLIDLSATHVPDLLISGATALTAAGDGRGGFTQLRPLPDPPAPAADLADPRVHLADMSGDGLTDLVLVHDGAVRYWPNLGRGRFDDPVDMSDPPRFTDASSDPGLGFDPRRLLLGDLTGDGTADLVYVADGTTTIWLNQSGNGFTAPTLISGTPRVTDVTAVRLADIDGTGVAGILWTGVGPEARWAFLNPSGGTKPYLLTGIDNHRGATTEMTWSTSTRYAQADRDLGRPWRTSLPFPVHVLASTATRDDFAHTLTTEEYTYHEGYWDPVDREFRGFSCVEHTDTLTPTAPASPAGATVTALDPLIPSSRLPDGFDPARQGNLLRNWSFDLAGTGAATTLTTTNEHPSGGGPSAAAEWGTWNNTTSTTTTALEPSTLPQGAGGTMMHVTTTGAGCGIVQAFLEPDKGPARAVTSVWVYVVRGAVQVGTGNGGNTGADAVCRTLNEWVLVQAGNGRSPANEVIVYAADPAGAEFYVDHAWVRADLTPTDSLTSPPVRTVTWFHPGPVGTARGPWTVPDSSDDYWPGDPPLRDPVDLGLLPDQLPRPTLREALRALRGTILRTETYTDTPAGSDDSNLLERPYEVHDGVHQVVPVLDGRSLDDSSWAQRPTVSIRSVLTRSSTWDRGTDPMTHLSASGQYDDYGRPHALVEAGVPRGRDPRQPGEACLATLTRQEFATRDDTTLFRLDCPAQRTRHEAIDPGTGAVVDFLTEALVGHADGARRALELSYYDGPAFTGLPLGQLGEHGLHTRTESLTVTPDLLNLITQPAVPGGTSAPPVPYLPANGGPPQPDWGSGYPAAFRTAVLAGPSTRGPALGYVWHDDAPPLVRGYYIQTSRPAYDVQLPLSGTTPRGLTVGALDPYGGQSTTVWDEYQLLVASTTDPSGLSTTASYDYRVLKPTLVTDPNGNRSAAGYTPLGLPAWTAHLGKVGQSEGDTAEQPGHAFSYDLSVWGDAVNAGASPQPVSVTTVTRVEHRWTLVARENQARVKDGQPALTDLEIAAMFGANERGDHPDRFMQVTDFSDGHGRPLQSRRQADEITVSDVGLPAKPSAASTTVTADPAGEQPRVVVSGWVVYDNKGRPVVTYEPFYDAGYRYSEPAAARLARLAGVRRRYDPRGRPTLTTAADGGVTRIVYGVPEDVTAPDAAAPTPWETYTYDPSDNAGRTHPTLTLAQSDHWNTPSSVSVDALGRTLRTTVRGLAADVVTEHRYNIDGHLLSVTDPMGRQAAQLVYDLAGRPWLTWILDAGASRDVHDAAGGIVEHLDDRSARNLSAFDVAHRATRTWGADRASQQPTLRRRVIHGDDPEAALTAEQAAAANARGRVVTTLDEAGRVITAGYDLDGHPKATTRQILRPDLLVSLLPTAASIQQAWADTSYVIDWPGPGEPAAATESLLDPAAYTTGCEFDALGRMVTTTFPVDVTGARARADFRYTRGGGLASLSVDDVPYLRQASYDAQGRRTLELAGNGILSRFLYDPDSARLRRHHAQHVAASDGRTWVTDGPVQMDHTYRRDVAGHLLTIADRTPGCGVPPADPDRLDRQCNYDPLDRLVRATGRETDTAPAQPWIDVPRSDDPTRARTYAETYTYDVLGNLTQLQHATTGNGAYTRVFALTPGSNQMAALTSGNLAVPYGYDPAGSVVSEASNRLFEWDGRRRLVTFRDQAGDTTPSVYAQYRYNSTGERVVKVVRRSSGPDQVTIYLGGLERTVLGSVGAPTATYDRIQLSDGAARLADIRRGDPLPDDPLGSEPALYHLPDHLGSICATLSGDGSMLSREEYLPYGETAFGSYARKRYRFTGRQRDEESGLSYHHARYYAPWLGRWTSTDPVGTVDGPSLYVYGRADPMTWVDLTGTQAKPKQLHLVEGVSQDVRATASGRGYGQQLRNKFQSLADQWGVGKVDVGHDVPFSQTPAGVVTKVRPQLATENRSEGAAIRMANERLRALGQFVREKGEDLTAKLRSYAKGQPVLNHQLAGTIRPTVQPQPALQSAVIAESPIAKASKIPAQVELDFTKTTGTMVRLEAQVPQALGETQALAALGQVAESSSSGVLGAVKNVGGKAIPMLGTALALHAIRQEWRAGEYWNAALDVPSLIPALGTLWTPIAVGLHTNNAY